MVSTGRWNNELSWRLPLYIQAIPAGLNVLLVYLCPESPRWLYSIGRKDDARAILAKFHSRTRDLNSPVVNIEIDEIEEKVTLEGADSTSMQLTSRIISNKVCREVVGLQTSVQDVNRSLPHVDGHHDWCIRSALRQWDDHLLPPYLIEERWYFG